MIRKIGWILWKILKVIFWIAGLAFIVLAANYILDDFKGKK